MNDILPEIIVQLAALLAGAFISEVTSRRAQRTKAPFWAVWQKAESDSYELRRPGNDRTLGSSQLTCPTTSRVAFWNNGVKTIMSDDLRTRDPLRVVPLGRSVIIGIQLVRTTSAGTNLSVFYDERIGWTIDFDYLKKNQGMVVDVLHSGEDYRYVAVVGELQEGEAIRRARLPKFPLYPMSTFVGRRLSFRMRH